MTTRKATPREVAAMMVDYNDGNDWTQTDPHLVICGITILTHRKYLPPSELARLIRNELEALIREQRGEK
jgi:hypothetical protein